MVDICRAGVEGAQHRQQRVLARRRPRHRLGRQYVSRQRRMRINLSVKIGQSFSGCTVMSRRGAHCARASAHAGPPRSDRRRAIPSVPARAASGSGDMVHLPNVRPKRCGAALPPTAGSRRQWWRVAISFSFDRRPCGLPGSPARADLDAGGGHGESGPDGGETVGDCRVGRGRRRSNRPAGVAATLLPVGRIALPADISQRALAQSRRRSCRARAPTRDGGVPRPRH